MAEELGNKATARRGRGNGQQEPQQVGAAEGLGNPESHNKSRKRNCTTQGATSSRARDGLCHKSEQQEGEVEEFTTARATTRRDAEYREVGKQEMEINSICLVFISYFQKCSSITFY